MQTLVVKHNTTVMDPDFLKARKFIRNKILQFLLQRQPQTNKIPPNKILDIVKRLEEGLYKAAATMEDYMNLDTLESRLHVFVKRPQFNNPRNSQFVNSSTHVSMMIPTPGLSQNESSNLVISSSMDNSVTASTCSKSSTASSRNWLQMANGACTGIHCGSVHASDGCLSNGLHLSSANFSTNSGGNNIMSSKGGSGVVSQMIPTPGLNSSSNNISMIMESASNDSGFSNADSSLAPQRLPQKQPAGGESDHVLQSLGSQMPGGVKSSVQSKLDALGFSETTTSSVKISPPTGDTSTIKTTKTPVSGDRFSPAKSDGPVLNNKNFSQVSLQHSPRPSSVACNQSHQTNLRSPQSTSHVKSQDGSENLKFQSPQAQRENLLLSHQQYNEQSHQFVKHQNSASHQWQQKQARQQHQVSLAIDAFGLSQLSSDVRSPVRTEHVAEVPQAQISNFYEHLKLPDEFPQSSADKCGGRTQPSILPSDSHDTYLGLPPNPQHLLQSHLLGPEAQFDSVPPGTQLNSLMVPWHSQSEDTSSLSGSLLHVNKVHEQFHQRIGVYDEAQCSTLPSEGSNIGLNPVKNSAGLHSSSSNFSRSANANRDRQFRNQQRWLLFLRHARRCAAPEGKCIDNCATVKKLCTHIDVCDVSHCSYPRCRHTKILIQHHKHCRETGCPVCAPVRKYLQAQLKARMCKQSDLSLQGSVSRSCKSSDDGKLNATPNPYPIVEVMEDSEPSLKRLKAEPPSNSVIAENGIVVVPLQARNDAQVPLHLEAQEFQRNGASVHFKSEFIEVKMKTPEGSGLTMTDMKDGLDAPCSYNSVGGSMLMDSTLSGMQEIVEFEKGEGEIEQKDGLHSSEHGVGTKSGKPKINGVSLTELFTPEQIREHIRGLRQWVGQCKAKVEKNQSMKHTMSLNSCQLCAVEKLNFEPPPIYCTRCGCRIKRNAMYYTSGAGDTRHYFCVPCYNEARGETMMVDGTAVPKARFEKKKNDEETEESWVQCDKCEAWQHQICALFNGRRNDGGQAEYTCPYCYIQEIESGERKPLPQSAVLGAKDLPRTVLSDHIEQRLLRRVKYERHERARTQGKSYDEVPGVEGIVVRVVSSVDKRLEVKPRFLETFREGNYPSEFPYKSKVILLFQKIEGVEVCLFSMYVQEFGSECQPPNQRRVYLSYLDSVKYFRPEVKAVTGEALRTYVYHEILIGYLAYCKKRGFTSCYIWACPPLKGEDYILYCHPEIQRTPKSDKLREWYLSMLKKASKENIVVELTNLYDHFFVSTGECKAKVTAARLPYFDGDYWPGAAEDTFEQLSQEEDGRKLNKRGTTKKAFTKRNLKASGEADLCSNASKDLVLMHKCSFGASLDGMKSELHIKYDELGETILPMKDDFIMVHLQYACSRCYIIMVSGNRWICKHCKDFKICHECYEAEQKLDERERHPVGHKDMHTLYPIEITDVPEDTKDKDESLESEFFDTRQAFLSLCQGNHYQYDTLRRAKHSSMMVLYHLHNPTAPAFVTTCYICHLDIETGQGWRCETCPDYDVCNDCYEKGGINHPHKLTNHPSMGDRDTQSKEARQLRVVQLRKMLDLLVHASQCRSPHCQYPNCRKVKGLFRHGIQCKVRPSGGCVLCKKMWYLLQLHSRACKESDCHVPRCRDLKEHLRRLQQQSDSRRRAAVTEMMRQRAAEVAGKSG